MGFAALPYNPADAARVEAAALQRMFRPLTEAENAKAQAIFQMVNAAKHRGENPNNIVIANTPIANNLFIDPAVDPLRKTHIFSGASFLEYFQAGNTGNDDLLFYLRMLCIYLNRRVGRGDSGRNRPNVPFASVGRALRGDVEAMRSRSNLNVELVSKYLTEDGLSHAPSRY